MTDRELVSANSSEKDARVTGNAPGDGDVITEILVSEATLEEPVADEQDELQSSSTEIPEVFSELKRTLETQGFNPEIHRLGKPSDREFRLQFDLAAGRDTLVTIVDEAAAHILLGVDVSAWRSLQRYDGIWNEKEGIIEVAVRGERFSLSTSYLLRRLSGFQDHDGSAVDPESIGLDLTDPKSGVSLRIGKVSEIASALMSTPLRPGRGSVTLRIMNVSVSTSKEADDTVERVADALFLDLDMLLGMALIPQRLESRKIVRGRAIRRRANLASINFPRNNYPHAPILLYQAGRQRITAPLIRYWSFYQVLEYFFPEHSEAETIRRLARHLRSPTFDPHRDEDVVKAAHLAANSSKSPSSEEEQLITTLKAITTAEEIAEIAVASDIVDQLKTKSSELTEKVVKLDGSSDSILHLAQRIYDIRCNIVHSKSASQRGVGPGLLPGSHHDDLVRNELPLMEYLAQQALISAAAPLVLPQRGASS